MNDMGGLDYLVELIEKYMRLIESKEGITFVQCINEPNSKIIFTNEEAEFLNLLNEKIIREDDAR